MKTDGSLLKRVTNVLLKTADTKQEMVDTMRKFMQDKTGSVKIHKEDGKIQEERTYQRKDDPRENKRLNITIKQGGIMVWSSKTLFLKMRDRTFVFCE